MKVRKELIENAKAIDIAAPEEKAWVDGYMACLDEIGTWDVDRLRELAEADKAGRLMVLKCKPGDTVYLIKFLYLWADRPIEVKVERVANYVRSDLLYTAVTRDKVMRSFVGADVGKTVFLTREEAEKALEEAKHGNQQEKA
mgnify:CR=1 FL=1